MSDWKTSPPTGLEAAIATFKYSLPGWWFSVSECQVSADATCAPTAECSHIDLIPYDGRFDSGFRVDLLQPATMADALRTVMIEAQGAVFAAFRKRGSGA